jgi:hypothetical protein
MILRLMKHCAVDRAVMAGSHCDESPKSTMQVWPLQRLLLPTLLLAAGWTAEAGA